MKIPGLAGRKLILEEHALAHIAKEIERQLFLLEEKAPGDHQRLCYLIAVLGSRSTSADRKELHQILDRLIDHIARNPPRSLLPKRNAYDREEEQRTDVNHALTWLLQAVDEKTLLDRYAAQLLRLRREARGAWKGEVDLALKVCRLDDRLELRAARERLRGVRPVRARVTAVFHGQEFKLAFSPDGKHLATAGTDQVKIWSTADWSHVASINVHRHVYSVQFTADGRYLDLMGGHPESLSRYRVAYRPTNP